MIHKIIGSTVVAVLLSVAALVLETEKESNE